MIRPRPLRALWACLTFAAVSACGGSSGGQDRPEILSTFPAAGQVLPDLPAYVRVVYDQRVHVLNDEAARITAYPATGSVEVPVHLYSDPRDDHAVLVVPAGGGHFEPNSPHNVAILEGAVVNDDDHYRLDRYDLSFTTGVRPSLFIGSDDGSVYEVDPTTGAALGATAPPAGFRASDVTGADGRVFVWLDPVAPGDSVLASFVPGAATITTTYTLSGETGTRTGADLVMSRDGRLVYATARDSGTNRLFLHRLDVASGAEVLPAISLSPVLSPSIPTYRPAIDVRRDHLFVPFGDGAGGGLLAVVDLVAWQELDAGPGPGVDALPLVDGAGPAAYEPLTDFLYVLLSDETSAGFVVVGPVDHVQFPAREVAFPGVPRVAYPVPDGTRFLDGLDGYSGLVGMVQSDTKEINEGFGVEVRDDVGGVLQGSTRVGAIVTDPAAWRFFVLSDDGARTFLTTYDFEDRDFFQVDLDSATPGVQAISLAVSAPGAALSATTVFGHLPP